MSWVLLSWVLLSWVAWFWLLAVVLLVASLVCLRVAWWHKREAVYWSTVAELTGSDSADPRDVDKTFGPILEWTQSHRAGLAERVRGWRPPHERMIRAALPNLSLDSEAGPEAGPEDADS